MSTRLCAFAGELFIQFAPKAHQWRKISVTFYAGDIRRNT